MITFSEKLKNISRFYDSLEDPLSKEIFKTRYEYMQKNTPETLFLELKPDTLRYCSDQVDAFLQQRPSAKPENTDVIIFGAGSDGKCVKAILEDYHFPICGFCDNDVQKAHGEFCGLPVITPEELKARCHDVTVAVATRKYAKEILAQLLLMGYSEENIMFGGGFFLGKYGRQYFDLEAMQPGKNEVFVDAGAYDCETSLEFIKWCKGDYKHIYAFEPDENNLNRCRDTIQKQDVSNITLLPSGLWDYSGVLSFDRRSGTASRIDAGGDDQVKVSCLDDLSTPDKITYIKMDIEGAELAALRGAQKTIRRDAPRLAISLYHKLADVIDIPLYLMEIRPDYRFFLRHYTHCPWETVLYACL